MVHCGKESNFDLVSFNQYLRNHFDLECPCQEAIAKIRKGCRERVAMYKERFGKRITTILSERGWDKERAAAVFEVSETMISKYLAGDNFPETEAFLRMADVFNVSADWLGGRSECREIATNKTPKR